MSATCIEHGLIFFVEIVRKIESGCKFYTTACGRSEILLHIEFAKLIEERALNLSNSGLIHRNQVTLALCHPWMGRIVMLVAIVSLHQ